MGDSLYNYPKCSIVKESNEKKNCDNTLFLGLKSKLQVFPKIDRS